MEVFNPTGGLSMQMLKEFRIRYLPTRVVFSDSTAANGNRIPSVPLNVSRQLRIATTVANVEQCTLSSAKSRNDLMHDAFWEYIPSAALGEWLGFCIMVGRYGRGVL